MNFDERRVVSKTSNLSSCEIAEFVDVIKSSNSEVMKIVFVLGINLLWKNHVSRTNIAKVIQLSIVSHL